MKKLLSIFLSVLITLSVLVMVPTVSGTEVSGNYRYIKQADNTAVITKYTGKEENVTVPSSIKGSKVVTIYRMAFANNKSIKTVSIPSTVKSMGMYAFAGCRNLKKVTIGGGITTIPNYAFSECNSITSLVIPNQVKVLGLDALPSKLKYLSIGEKLQRVNPITLCDTSLCKITVSKKNRNFASKDGVLYNKKMTTLVSYPNSRVNKSFTIPSSVKEIGWLSFAYQKNLQKVSFPKSVKTIRAKAFMNCENLTAIKIPNSVTVISTQGFSGCSNVKELTITPNKNLKIYNFAFGNIKKLKKLTVPKVYGKEVFGGCDSLTKVTIPSNVKTLTEREFFDCRNLTAVTVPKTVTKIGKQALGYIENGYGDQFTKITGFTIKGVKGSAAYKYAKKNGFKFVAI